MRISNETNQSTIRASEEVSGVIRSMKKLLRNKFNTNTDIKLKNLDTKVIKLKHVLQETKSNHERYKLLVKIGEAFEKRAELVNGKPKTTMKEEAIFNAITYYGWALKLNSNDSKLINKHIHLVSLFMDNKKASRSSNTPTAFSHVLCSNAFEAIGLDTKNYNAAQAYAKAFMEQSKAGEDRKPQELDKRRAINMAIFYYLHVIKVSLSNLNENSTKKIKQLYKANEINKLLGDIAEKSNQLAIQQESTRLSATEKAKITVELLSKIISYYHKALALHPDEDQQFEFLIKMGDAFAQQYEMIDANSRSAAKKAAISQASNCYMKALDLSPQLEKKFEIYTKLSDAFAKKAKIINEQSAKFLKREVTQAKQHLALSKPECKSVPAPANKQQIISVTPVRPAPAPTRQLSLQASIKPNSLIPQAVKDRLSMFYSFLKVSLQSGDQMKNNMLSDRVVIMPLVIIQFMNLLIQATTGTRSLADRPTVQSRRGPSIWVLPDENDSPKNTIAAEDHAAEQQLGPISH